MHRWVPLAKCCDREASSNFCAFATGLTISGKAPPMQNHRAVLPGGSPKPRGVQDARPRRGRDVTRRPARPYFYAGAALPLGPGAVGIDQFVRATGRVVIGSVNR